MSMRHDHVKNVERNSRNLRSKLSKLYHTVPEHKMILRCVRDGRSQFEALFGYLLMHDKYSLHMSCVHSYEDVEVQAFILALPSVGNDGEMTMKVYLTYATHWVDDFFDQFQFEPGMKAKVKTERADLKNVLALLGRVFSGTIQTLYTHSVHSSAVEKGVHRLLYGSLINHADCQDEQRQYLREHANIFLSDLDPRLQCEIQEKLSPLVVGLTNKTTQEFWFACESIYDPNITALYTLLYTPALYFHDHEEESSEEELQFLSGAAPSNKELIAMIELFRALIDKYHDEKKSLRFRQLSFLIESFQAVLPAEINLAYEKVLSSQ